MRATGVTPIPAGMRAAMTPTSWRPGCPVALGDLRVVRVSHWDFEGRVRTGTLIVHRDAASAVVTAMRTLYRARFLEGMDTAQSVREASLRVLRRRREAAVSTHPYFWAAFVAAGDWR